MTGEKCELVGKFNCCMELRELFVCCALPAFSNLWNADNFFFLFQGIIYILLLFVSKTGFELWERGNQNQRLLQRNEWINLILFSLHCNLTNFYLCNVETKPCT